MKKPIQIISHFKKIKELLKANKRTLLALLIASIFGDILFLKDSSDIVIFSIIILYVIFIKLFHLKSKVTFLIALSLLLIMFGNYVVNNTSVLTEKAAVWFVLFLGIGIVQQWRE